MPKIAKIIEFDEKARQKLLRGIEVVDRAVGSTLGPRSRNVAVDDVPNYDISPTVLHDGVSVARRINLPDPLEDMGARLVKGASLKTNEVAGDGTTTSTILAHAIIAEAFKQIGSGANPMALKREIEEASKRVIEGLTKIKKDVKSDAELEQIATISSADPDIGKMVAGAIKKVGEDGVVTVEEGNSSETTVDYKAGMEIEKGMLSPYFVTDSERVEAVVEDAYVLLTDRKLQYATDIVPFLEKFVRETKSKNLVIFAGEVIEEALATLVVNKLRDNLNVTAIQAPAYGGRRVDELDDIAVLTGGHPVFQDEGREIKDMDISELGRAGKIVASREKTVIVDGKGDKTAVDKRIEELKKQIESSDTGFDRDVKEERLAKLSGGVAVINVGANTEVELKEKKERVIDAVSATEAANQEGIVAGGEVSLLYSSSGGQFNTAGGKILGEALKAPFKRLMENSGFDYAETLQKLAGKEYPVVIDVMDGEVKDMIASGIIYPLKVTKTALENAVSVAVMAIKTSCLITDVVEKGGEDA